MVHFRDMQQIYLFLKKNKQIEICFKITNYFPKISVLKKTRRLILPSNIMAQVFF